MELEEACEKVDADQAASEGTIEEMSEDGRTISIEGSIQNDVDYDGAIDKIKASNAKLDDSLEVPEQEFSMGKKAFFLKMPSNAPSGDLSRAVSFDHPIESKLSTSRRQKPHAPTQSMRMKHADAKALHE